MCSIVLCLKDKTEKSCAVFSDYASFLLSIFFTSHSTWILLSLNILLTFAFLCLHFNILLTLLASGLPLLDYAATQGGRVVDAN